jgi:periplasmic protein CpxP/Spy
MKSIRNLLAGSLMAAAALATATASISVATAADDTAPPASPGRPHGWHNHEGHLLSKLNLTAEQQASVKAIMANAGPQMKSLHQEMMANTLKLQNTQPNDPNYANVVAEVTQANGALHSQMISQKADTRAQVFKVLTPAQQTQLATLEAQMQARMQARMQSRGQGAPAAQ